MVLHMDHTIVMITAGRIISMVDHIHTIGIIITDQHILTIVIITIITTNNKY